MKVEPNYQTKPFVRRYFLVFICVIAILLIFVSYYAQLNKSVSSTAIEYLKEISNQSAKAVDNKIEGDFQTLEALSVFIGSLPTFDVGQVRTILEKTNKKNKFSRIEIALSNGKAYVTSSSKDTRQSYTKQIGDKEYFKRALSGEAKVCQYVAETKGSGGSYIFATPIYKNDEVIGVLAAVQKDNFIGQVMSETVLKGKEHSFIIHQNGKKIFDTQNDTKELLNHDSILAFQNTEQIPNENLKLLDEEIKAGKSGIIEYTNQNDGMYISYYPLNSIPDYWISMISSSIIESKVKTVQAMVNQLTGYLVFLFILMIIFVIYTRKQIKLKLENNNRQIAITNERYGIITEQSGSIIFEYDMTTGTAFHTANFKEKFGYDPITDNYLIKIMNSEKIHAEDKDTLMALYDNIQNGKKYDETEVRIQRKDSTYLWIRIKAAGIFDKDKSLLRIVGKMIDITEEKQEIENLKAKVNKDSVTGVYNKQTTHNLIADFLTGEGKEGNHALLVIDIDDFKGINDALGHRQGDAIILTLAEEMKAMFRTEDIIGRIGGDEFMVLIKNITDMNLVAEKAKSICNIFQEKITGQYNTAIVSNSVGIAIYGKDGINYEELYEAADKALYRSKYEGKGTFVFHNAPYYLT